MNNRIDDILSQIKHLEDELLRILQEKQGEINYQLKGKKVEFERNIKLQHQRIRESTLRYISNSELKHIISAPFIYVMVVPMLLLDFMLFFYQHICFRLYGIKRIERTSYIVIDQHHLSYLNLIQKINCVYCSYANGLFAYAREIGSVTEQYWCPIKHASKVLGTHQRYPRFLEYGDGEQFRDKARKLREEIIASDAD